MNQIGKEIPPVIAGKYFRDVGKENDKSTMIFLIIFLVIVGIFSAITISWAAFGIIVPTKVIKVLIVIALLALGVSSSVACEDFRASRSTVFGHATIAVIVSALSGIIIVKLF